MNKKYLDPEMNVTLFESVDVITTSGVELPDDELTGGTGVEGEDDGL